MLVWSGWGLLVIVLAIPAGIVSEFIGVAAAAVVPLDKPILLSLIAAVWGIGWGVSCMLVGRRINDPKKDRLVVDVKTNQQILLRKRSKLFWIPVEHWGYPIIAVTIIYVAVTLWNYA